MEVFHDQFEVVRPRQLGQLREGLVSRDAVERFLQVKQQHSHLAQWTLRAFLVSCHASKSLHHLVDEKDRLSRPSTRQRAE